MEHKSIRLVDLFAYLVATKKTLGLRWDDKIESKKLVKIANRFDKKLDKLLPEDLRAEFTKNLAIEYKRFEEAKTSKKEAQ